jgi:flagellar protein FliS
MMNQQQVNAYSQYRNTAIFTANPERLLLMLYDGLVQFLRQARQAVEQKDIAGANSNLIKSQNIINELMNTLNMDYDISADLYQLYDYLNRRLIEANVKKDTGIIDEVLGLVADLRTTWAEANHQVPAQTVAG